MSKVLKDKFLGNVVSNQDNYDSLMLADKLKNAFYTTDQQLLSEAKSGKLGWNVGSTASVLFLKPSSPVDLQTNEWSVDLILGHVGDSRILLCDASGQVVQLTKDHKPSVVEELNRIRNSGGFVENLGGEDRVMGLLNMSRSMGDYGLKKHVTCDPDVQVVKKCGKDIEFICLLTDGLTSHLSNEEICSIIEKEHDPTEGAKKVVSVATDFAGEVDNCTCIVLRFPGWK